MTLPSSYKTYLKEGTFLISGGRGLGVGPEYLCFGYKKNVPPPFLSKKIHGLSLGDKKIFDAPLLSVILSHLNSAGYLDNLQTYEASTNFIYFVILPNTCTCFPPLIY